jgi:hypothetical protein
MITEYFIEASLSKNARALWQALRRLANRHGELKQGATWYQATEFDRAALMCRQVRQVAMLELIARGLVTVERVHEERVINGRKRVVFGVTHHTLHLPKVVNDKN